MLCPYCDYDLTGLHAGPGSCQCPECGGYVSASALARHERRMRWVLARLTVPWALLTPFAVYFAPANLDWHSGLWLRWLAAVAVVVSLLVGAGPLVISGRPGDGTLKRNAIGLGLLVNALLFMLAWGWGAALMGSAC